MATINERKVELFTLALKEETKQHFLLPRRNVCLGKARF